MNNLISIARGWMPERSLRHLDLFSGIGGFALAARMVGGIKTAQFVEIDPYCQRVLAKNFPGVPIHGDVTTFTAESGQYDIITGGFPCQDISCANPNGRGLEGERSGLFFEIMRIVRQCRPRYIVLENVSALLSKHGGRAMGTVLWDLSQSGYDAEWQVISAGSVGAPHLRERVFIVAYRDSQRRNNGGHSWAMGEIDALCNSNGFRLENPTPTHKGGPISQLGSDETLPHTHRTGCKELDPPPIPIKSGHNTGGLTPEWNPWRTEPGILRVVDGIPHRVDRIRGLGNAVVPQVATIALKRVLTLSSNLL